MLSSLPASSLLPLALKSSYPSPPEITRIRPPEQYIFSKPSNIFYVFTLDKIYNLYLPAPAPPSLRPALSLARPGPLLAPVWAATPPGSGDISTLVRNLTSS